MPNNIEFSNPPTIATPPGYTHVVKVTGGSLVYISGQIALDKTGNLVGQNDFRVQTQQVFENIKAALTSVEATFANVIKLNMYVVDISQLPTLREVRDNYINAQNPPASTLVQVVQLANKDFLIEIEAIAALEK